MWGHRVSACEESWSLAGCFKTHLRVELEELLKLLEISCMKQVLQADFSLIMIQYLSIGVKQPSLIGHVHSSLKTLLYLKRAIISLVLSYTTFYSTLPSAFNVSWSHHASFTALSFIDCNKTSEVGLPACLPAADRMPDSLLRLEQNNAGKDILSFSWSPRVPKKRGCSEK